MSLSLALKFSAAPLLKGVGGPAWLAAFMAGQSAGFWWAFTSPDRMFQENVGPTPANDPSEVIGLSLSQRQSGAKTLAQVLAEATELVSNPGGPFTATTGWTQQQGVMSVVSGKLRATASAVSNGRLTIPITCVIGKSYAMDLSGLVATASANVSITNSTVSTAGAPLTALSDGRRYFTATQTTHYVMIVASSGVDNTYAEIGSVSVKEVSSYAATQATGSFKPTVQPGGAKGDATDDRLGIGFASTSGDAFNVYPAAIIPASLAATQVFAGAMDGSSNGDYLAVTTGGALRAKVGATTLDSTTIDLRGGTHDLAYWTEGATLYLYADGAIVASGAWTGSRPTTAWNLFALNNNGTASNFSGATMKAALRGTQALTASLANQICRAA